VQERINGFHSINHSHSLYGSEFALTKENGYKFMQIKKIVFFLVQQNKIAPKRDFPCAKLLNYRSFSQGNISNAFKGDSPEHRDGRFS
jgi:hypothetical protein